MTVYLLSDGFDAARTAFETALIEALRTADCRMVVLPDPYRLPADSPLLTAWANAIRKQGADRLGMLSWLYPRAVECLLRNLPGETMNTETAPRVFDMKTFATPDEGARIVIEALNLTSRERPGETETFEDSADAPVRRWYPVVDTRRCTACGQCVSFCLFEVYERDADENRIRVARPDNCKAGCPACSRICPEGAILFPLCDEPAIAGAPGHVMRPDPEMKATYYRRTGRPCPVCGQSYAKLAAGFVGTGGTGCRECGLPLAGKPSEPPDEDLDALIAELENLL